MAAARGAAGRGGAGSCGAGLRVEPDADELHAGKGRRRHACDSAAGQLGDGVGDELEGGNPDHGTGGKAEAGGAEGGAGLEEEECRGGDERLREAGGDAGEGCAEGGDAARDEDEGDGEALRDIVHREGGGDEDAEARAVGAAEGRPDAEALSEGMQRHHPHHQQNFGRLQEWSVT